MGSTLSRRERGGDFRPHSDGDFVFRQAVEIIDKLVNGLFKLGPPETVPLAHANQCIRRYIPKSFRNILSRKLTRKKYSCAFEVNGGHFSRSFIVAAAQ